MVGNIIKNMRKNAGLTQKELGKILNVYDTTISSYERENSQPDFETIIKIATVCGYSFKVIDKNGKVLSLDGMAKEI